MKYPPHLSLIFAAALPTMVALAQPPPPAEAADAPATQAAVAVPTDLPAGAAEVVRLSEAGTGEDVLVSFIHNSNDRFNLSADQILYLRDIGFSSTVISAMLTRDHELQNQPQSYTYDQKAYVPANPAAVAPQPTAVAPQEQQPPPPTAPAPASVSNPPADATYFYNDLSPYGTWVDLDGVGWCWQPRVVVVNHGWRPYCDGGNWVYSDAGWYWQSSYSWGWAPFHYGRWQLHPRCGWVWLPDRVWGPSWVVWRSETDHCGWAPLPPHAVFAAGIGWSFNGVRVGVGFDFGLRPDHYTFVAMKDFNNHDLGHHRLAAAEVTRVYNHTTVINNYTVNNNHTIVNQGIQVDRVAAATHSQIRTVAIHDAPARRAGAPPAQSPARSSSVIYRPQLAAPARRETMVAQKVDDRHPVVQHAPVAAANPQYAPATRTGSTSGNGSSSRQPAGNSGSYQRPVNPAPAPGPNNPARQAHPAPVPQASPAPARTSNGAVPRPDQGSRPSNSRTPVESQTSPPRETRPASKPHSSGEYYPKSYRQAAEIHALPPLNPGPDSPASAQPNNPAAHNHKN